MAEIRLKSGLVVYLDDADLSLVERFSWGRQGTNGMNYASTSIHMHRLLMGVKVGDGMVVDHRDGNGLNNRRENLRVCTVAENCHNRRAFGKDSKYKGVSFWPRGGKKKWRARIAINGKPKTLGYFATQEEAALAFNKVAIEEHGDFAWLNELNG